MGALAKSPSKLSSACVAIALFIAASPIAGQIYNRYAAGKAQNSNNQQENFLKKQIAEFRALAKCPSIVLMGSSILAGPFWLSDKDTEQDKQRAYDDRDLKVPSLRKMLAHDGVPEPTVFSLAANAEMVSDQYLETYKFIKNDHAPKWLILGVMPRDFSDTGPIFPNQSVPFAVFAELPDMAALSELYLPTFDNKVDFVLNRSIFFYRYRGTFQDKFGQLVARGLHSDGAPAVQTEFTDEMSGSTWSKSIKEYRRHYRYLRQESIATQSACLDRMLALCAARNVNVLLLNMPLSADNRDLLPAGFYGGFRHNLAAIASKHKVAYADLGDSLLFSREDFHDTAHLNGKGAVKLSTVIAQKILGTSTELATVGPAPN